MTRSEASRLLSSAIGRPILVGLEMRLTKAEAAIVDRTSTSAQLQELDLLIGWVFEKADGNQELIKRGECCEIYCPDYHAKPIPHGRRCRKCTCKEHARKTAPRKLRHPDWN